LAEEKIGGKVLEFHLFCDTYSSFVATEAIEVLTKFHRICYNVTVVDKVVSIKRYFLSPDNLPGYRYCFLQPINYKWIGRKCSFNGTMKSIATFLKTY
jgi:hypothetical protein